MTDYRKIRAVIAGAHDAYTWPRLDPILPTPTQAPLPEVVDEIVRVAEDQLQNDTTSRRGWRRGDMGPGRHDVTEVPAQMMISGETAKIWDGLQSTRRSTSDHLTTDETADWDLPISRSAGGRGPTRVGRPLWDQSHTETTIAVQDVVDLVCNEREREVIKRYYDGGESFNEIAADWGKAKNSASKIHARAIEKLRGALRENSAALFQPKMDALDRWAVEQAEIRRMMCEYTSTTPWDKPTRWLTRGERRALTWAIVDAGHEGRDRIERMLEEIERGPSGPEPYWDRWVRDREYGPIPETDWDQWVRDRHERVRSANRPAKRRATTGR